MTDRGTPCVGGTVLVTGATSGLGLELVEALSRRGWLILVHGRDQKRGRQVVDELVAAGGRAQLHLADLSSLSEVAALAHAVAADHPVLDLLVNNAGVGSGPQGQRRQLSRDGIELRLAVNYLAPVLLSRMLRASLRAAPSGQILNIGSAGQSEVDLDDLQLGRRYDGMEAYVRSKFALAAFTFTAAEEYVAEGIHVNCSHPADYMDTTMVRDSGVTPWSSVQEGCRAVLYAIDHGAQETGVFYNGEHSGRAHRKTYDVHLRRRLQELTDGLIGDVKGLEQN